MEENFKIMNRDEIANRLNSIDDCPQRYFSFLVINPDYNPSGFSKEIEDSEEEAKIDDIFSKFLEPTKEDTCRSNEGNSKEWLENHSKICKLKFIPNGIAAEGTACMLADGTIGYNYCSDSLLDKIMKVGQIVDLC